MSNSEPEENRADRFDEAVRWALDHPEYQELMHNTYTTHDTVADAQRFADSEEFAATVKILSNLGHPPEDSPRILDAGCGNGIASYALSQAGYEVVAVDSSPSEVCGTCAAKKLQALEGVDFEVHTGDIRDIDFTEPFDVVYGRQFFHHMDEIGPVVDMFTNLLSTGGVLCALRDHVIWSEEQREQFLEEHPLHHITQGEGAYYLDEYRDAFSRDGLQLAVELHPFESPINTHPRSMNEIRDRIQDRIPLIPDTAFNMDSIDTALRYLAARFSRQNDQIYSFFSSYKD